MPHKDPNSKKWDYSDIPSGAHKRLKDPEAHNPHLHYFHTFRITKIWHTYGIIRSYLTSVTETELRRHLAYMDMIGMIFICTFAIQNISQTEKKKEFKYPLPDESYPSRVPLSHCPGVGLLCQFSPIRYIPNFPSLPKHKLAIEYHIYIWQVSPQLSCGDTCQIWLWIKESNRYICKIENFAYGKINERSFSKPQDNTMPHARL